MELYKPEPPNQRISEQRDRVNQLRRELAIGISHGKNMSDYVDSRSLALNQIANSLPNTKIAAVRNSLIRQ
jgi:hypothetical protein